jgi:hypothetical protein
MNAQAICAVGCGAAALAALLLAIPARSGDSDLCHLIPIAYVAEVTGKAARIERQATGSGNCVYYIGEVRGNPPLPEYMIELAHESDSGVLYAPMVFAGHEVANVGERAYWAETGTLWFIAQGNTYYIQFVLFDYGGGDALRIAGNLALTAIGNLPQTVAEESAGVEAPEVPPLF